MAKAPAFQFYVQDFIYGCRNFTTEEIGAYVLLLCEQWDNGFIIKEEDFLKKVAKISAKKLKNVLKKFEQVEEGVYKNIRLEKEREKAIKYRENQASNGKLGGRPVKEKKGLGFFGLTQTKANDNPNESPSSSTSSSTSLPSDDGNPPPPIFGLNEGVIKGFHKLENLSAAAAADMAFCEPLYQIGLELENIPGWLGAFNRWLAFNGESAKQEGDYRKHFSNWITKQKYRTTKGEDWQPVAGSLPANTNPHNGLTDEQNEAIFG